ncbi:hypothetical protein JCM11491_001538 [Sporobolomyces phaffii]
MVPEDPTDSPRRAPIASSPPSSSRKRQRDLDAHPAPAVPRPHKRNKHDGEMGAAPPDGDTTTRLVGRPLASDTTSSDTLAGASTQAHRDLGDDVSPLDALSAEDRRKLKGKAKATAPDNDGDGDGDDELARLTRQLAHKNSLIASQAALLATVRSTVACNVCLETLDKPYALACGHVLYVLPLGFAGCRKCLLEWFFRPDPSADDREPANSGTGSESESGTDSSGSDPLASRSGARSRSGSGSGSRTGGSSSPRSDSTASSYVGGSLRGQDFRIRNTAGNSTATFGAIADQIANAAFGTARGRVGAGDGNGDGDGGGPSGGRGRARITEAASSESEGDPDRAKEASADEMRKARLARFGGGGGAPTTTGIDDESAEARPPRDAASPRPRASTPSSPRRRRRSPSPRPVLAAAARLALPKGEHRANNLVCPQCRTACSERAPHRIFVLSELLVLVRAAERADTFDEASDASPSSSGPVRDRPGPGPAAATGGDERTDLVGLDEADTTWGGLFPGVGGIESAKDRRRRLAQVVRDRDDGVRRCGECNWEIDERSGLCEGCGRAWNMSSEGDGGSVSSSGDDDRGLRFRFGRYDRAQRAQARRHHAVVDSDRSDDDEESVGSRDGDDYESDDFLVRSGDEDAEDGGGSGGGARRGTGRARDGDDVIWSDDGGSEVERKRARRAARERRDRRRGGEVIDPGSDTESGSGTDDGSSDDSDDDAESGRSSRGDDSSRRHAAVILDSDNDDDGGGSPPPVPFHPRARTAPASSSSLSGSGSSRDEEKGEVRPPRRKKRVIEDEEESN